MIKDQILQTLQASLKSQSGKLNLEGANGNVPRLNIERPRQADHGDYAVNVSPLAKVARMAPPQIAAIVAEGFAQAGWTPNIIGGFLNFSVGEPQLIDALTRIAMQDKPGRNESMKDIRCLLEFVSANPTGPLHIGHGRWVALGDSLGRIFRHCDAQVTHEFYINDAGSQMFNIANSIWYRALEILGTGAKFPTPEEGKPFPFYPGDYVIEMAQEFIQTHREALFQWDNPAHVAPKEAIEAISDYAKESMLAQQRQLMETCRLTFDVWYSEKSLHAAGRVVDVIEKLKARGVTYEKDGALWFASTQFGDDQDRVLVKSDGSYTYLTADIAYHEDKYARNDGFYNLLINIWGADHHGYIPRMKAAMAALGHNPDQLEIVLGQLVNLLIEGERTRMGKRKKMLTLQELVDEVGVDALRFWMVSKSQDTTLDFNVDLAASASDENPVFYVQYAHARCASIVRNAFQPRFDTVDKKELPPLLTEAQWDSFLGSLTPDAMATLFASLENDPAKAALRELILKMDGFEDRVEEAARLRSPHIIARYTQDLAADFHRFYNVCRILVADPQTTMMRLVIIYALKRVFGQALDLLGVSAPDKM